MVERLKEISEQKMKMSRIYTQLLPSLTHPPLTLPFLFFVQSFCTKPSGGRTVASRGTDKSRLGNTWLGGRELPSIAQSCQSRVFLAPSSLLRGGWVKVKAAALLPLTLTHIRCNARGARLQIWVTTSSCLGQTNMLVIHEKLLFLKT